MVSKNVANAQQNPVLSKLGMAKIFEALHLGLN